MALGLSHRPSNLHSYTQKIFQAFREQRRPILGTIFDLDPLIHRNNS